MNSLTAREPLTRLAALLAAVLPLSLLGGNALADIAASTIAVLFLLHSWRARDWAWLKAPWVKLLLILWGYLIARSLFAEQPGTALGRALPWIRYALFALALAHWILPQPGAGRRIFLSLAATVSFLAFDALIQYAFGADLFGRPTVIASHSLRLTGPYEEPKVGMMLAMTALPVLLCLLFGKQRWLGAGLSLAVFAAVFLSGERMALLLLLMEIALAGAFMSRRIWPLFAIGGLAALAVTVLGMLNPGVMARQVHSTVNAIAHFKETPYGKIWMSAEKMIEAQPIFGVGPRHFRLACPDARYGATDAATLEERCNLHPHNLYLEWATEAGLAGLALFLATMAALGKALYPLFRAHRCDPLFTGLLILFAVKLWPLAAATSFSASWSAVPFWLGVGWMLGMYSAVTPGQGRGDTAEGSVC